MSAFRKFSDKYPFRHRSETPEIAIELSLQPWKTFGVDGVIMFSDILTPLPSMGVDFDVIKGTGPVISSPIRTREDVEAVKPMEDIGEKLPFVGETLKVQVWCVCCLLPSYLLRACRERQRGYMLFVCLTSLLVTTIRGGIFPALWNGHLYASWRVKHSCRRETSARGSNRSRGSEVCDKLQLMRGKSCD